MDEIEIFDRALRRRRRDRAALSFADHGELFDRIADELLFRLEGVQRRFERALDLGCHDGRLTAALRERGIASVPADPGFRFARAAGGVQCDEDRLPFADGSFDLVVSAGGLESVNDLPGALTLIRRILRPDGLFLAGMIGSGSLPILKRALLAADAASGGATPRVHPQIDVRSAGDLLARTGFTLPVADCERLELSYPHLLRLVADLRGTGATNLLVRRSRGGLGRSGLAAALSEFAAAAEDDGRTRESVEIVYLTGWAPAASQPQPARRGSATASLADALTRRPPTS